MKSSFSKKFTVDKRMIDNFADFSSDFNPIHMNEDKAIEAGFKGRVLHGAGLLGLVSSVIATEIPGPGSIILEIKSKFKKPAHDGDVILIKIVLEEYKKINHVADISFSIDDEEGISLCSGTSKVLYKLNN